MMQGWAMCKLLDIAIFAYRNERYADAVRWLLDIIDNDQENWIARLYLGMAYERSGQVANAERLLRRMANDCPDISLKRKATTALVLVEAEMRRSFSATAPAKFESKVIRKRTTAALTD